MSVTPTKICKRGRKAKEGNQNKKCRFCGTNFEVAGRRVSFQNLFSPTSREESPGSILAECVGTIGLPVTKNPNLSERVCIPCSRKIRNAAELYRFVEKAISATEDVSCENRNKRLLPTTITPERIKGKKQVIDIGGDEREIAPGKVNSRKSLFSQARDNSRLDSTSTEITSVGTLPEQDVDDILTSFCNVEDIAEKAETQIKVVILYPNGEVAVRKSFDKSTKSLITNLAVKSWKAAANHAFQHEELKDHIMEATRVAISAEFKALSKSDTILKGRKPEEVAAFSNRIFVHEISVFCPVWHACMKGACGITKAKSQNDKLTKSTNVMALATASLGRFRNEQLSAYAYRLSTILFHSGVKHTDILRLNRLGVCMSPQSVVNFQRQMGENFDAKVLLWKTNIEKNIGALRLLNSVQAEQVPVTGVGEQEMEFIVNIDFDETTLRSYPDFDPIVFKYCIDLLQVVRKRRNEDSLNSEVLKEAIAELQNQKIPSYK